LSVKLSFPAVITQRPTISFNLVYSSLIRPKEIATIKVKDINLTEKFVIIHAESAKNHKKRFSALSQQSIELITKLIAETKLKENDFLILGKDKIPMLSHSYGKTWDRMRKALKLPTEMQLYSLRDTGIYEMLKSGIDNLSVMQHADHSDLSITTIYAKHVDTQLVQKMNKILPKF